VAELGKFSNIFLLYPSFAGGNHLANLISLCHNVEPSWLDADALLKKYIDISRPGATKVNHGGLIAHHNNINIFESKIDRVFIHYDQLIRQQEEGYINIIQGHHHSFRKLIINLEYIAALKDIKWLVIKYPSKDSLGYKRLQIEKRGVDLLENEESIYNDVVKFDTSLPAPSHLHHVTEVFNFFPGNNSITIDSDRYFTYDGSKYIREILKSYFGLELPKIADRIHRLWIDMIEYRVVCDMLGDEY
jgi:hypothetical protein